MIFGLACQVRFETATRPVKFSECSAWQFLAIQQCYPTIVEKPEPLRHNTEHKGDGQHAGETLYA